MYSKKANANQQHLNLNNSNQQNLNLKNKRRKKEYGQHFLKNQFVIKKIITSIPSIYDNVIEIGPGNGALTYHLLKHFHVKAIEIDQDCVTVLNNKFANNISCTNESKRLEIICQNILEYSFAEAILPICVVGNLPYNIGTKIIEKILQVGEGEISKTKPKLETNLQPNLQTNLQTNPQANTFSNTKLHINCAVFMLQKEVAQRIINADSPLGIAVHARYFVKKIADAKPEDFSPKPKVDSQVIKLVKHDMFSQVDLEKLNTLTRLTFSNRRKKLSHLKKNNEKLVQLLIDNNINLNFRAQELEKEQYYQLAKLL